MMPASISETYFMYFDFFFFSETIAKSFHYFVFAGIEIEKFVFKLKKIFIYFSVYKCSVIQGNKL